MNMALHLLAPRYRVGVAEGARASLTGGWAHGPCEAWAFAVRLASGGDRDKRMAMLIVDNAVELALKAYLNLHHGQRGGPTVRLDPDPTFVKLLDGFEQCFAEWPSGLRRADLLWHHEVRNLLHHRGNGLTPDERQLRNYVAVTEALLRFLFGDDPVNEALQGEELLFLSAAAATAETPAIAVEIDEMITRIRRRAEQLPPDAAPQLAIPVGDVINLTDRASSFPPTAPTSTAQPASSSRRTWTGIGTSTGCRPRRPTRSRSWRSCSSRSR
jgi:hypothetical protein